MLPCPVLSPELIPENSQALISQHQHKTPGRNSILLRGTAQSSPNSQSLGCRGLGKDSDSSRRAGQGTQPHLSTEEQPDIPFRALLGYSHPCDSQSCCSCPTC